MSTPPPGPAAQLTNKTMFMLFPTPMFTGLLPDLALCDRVEKIVRDVQKSGKGVSAPDRTSPAYLTPDDLHLMPEMKEFVDIVMFETGNVLDQYKMKRDSHYITGMWANITHPNHRSNMHVHPNCFLSGLVYIKAPLSCGPTMFASPRKFTKNIEASYTEKNDLNSDHIIVPAEKGRMVIWPSHIPHAVEQGTANESEDRITVPFNIMIRGKVDLFTSRIEFT